MQRAELDMNVLNEWAGGEGASQRLTEAKQKQLELAMKRQLKSIQKESTTFRVEEEEDVVLSVSLPSALPSDERLDEMKVLYSCLDAKDEEIRELEIKLSEYNNMTFWERFVFLFTG